MTAGHRDNATQLITVPGYYNQPDIHRELQTETWRERNRQRGTDQNYMEADMDVIAATG